MLKKLLRPFSSSAAWLGYTALAWFIVVWGAFVRHSKSGDGCGDHWPLCNGSVVPTFEHSAIWIEYLHRATSGIFGILVLLAFIAALKTKASSIKLSGAVLFFTITEALIGALLVLSGVVNEDATFRKALYLGIHLLNTLLLFGALVLAYLDSRGVELKKPSKTDYLVLSTFFLVAAFGVVASLSQNVSTSLDFWADFSSDSHWTVRLRVLHLLLAAVLSLAIIYRRPSFLWAPIEIQIISGVVALVEKEAILWKLLHLGTSSLLWILLVFLAVTALKKTE